MQQQKITPLTNAERSLGNLRHLISQEKKEQIIEFKKHQKELQVPQTAAMQVTLIIKVTFSFIPQELLAKLAVVTIQKNESEFIAMLQDQSAFYTYFKPLDGISCNVVHDLTIPPTSQPTTHAHFLASQQQVSLNDDCGLEFGALVGIAIGLLWLFLTGCSILYLLRERTAMKEQYDLEDLLKHERSSPLDETVSSGTSFPMGCDDQETVNAELNILERKKQGMGASKATDSGYRSKSPLSTKTNSVYKRSLSGSLSKSGEYMSCATRSLRNSGSSSSNRRKYSARRTTLRELSSSLKRSFTEKNKHVKARVGISQSSHASGVQPYSDRSVVKVTKNLDRSGRSNYDEPLRVKVMKNLDRCASMPSDRSAKTNSVMKNLDRCASMPSSKDQVKKKDIDRSERRNANDPMSCAKVKKNLDRCASMPSDRSARTNSHEHMHSGALTKNLDRCASMPSAKAQAKQKNLDRSERSNAIDHMPCAKVKKNLDRCASMPSTKV